MACRRILLVEDEEVNLLHFQQTLEKLGYDAPAIARSGEEAVEKAGEIRPDLVLMDIYLAGEMDGIQAAQQIRARFNIPIVYLTSRTDPDALQQAQLTEPYGYLVKPVDERELYMTITLACYKHETEQNLRNLVEERTAELRKLNAELMLASRHKDEFLANMSHELRTPLNAILGYAQILKEDDHLTERQRQGLETIYTSGEHLLHLINDILDLSKIESGSMELHETEFHLPEFLSHLADMIKFRAEQKGLTFVFECDPALPIGIRADEKRLREVLLNLLGNAVKFTKQGSVTLRVRLGDGERGRWGDRERGRGGEGERQRLPSYSPIPPSHL